MFSVCGSGRVLVAVALGSGPGCSWGLLPVTCGLLSVSCFFLVGSKPGEERAPTPKPPVICVHFMSGIPSCLMFWDFSSLHQKHRASAGHLVVYFVTGLMVGDRRFPGATILGARFSSSSANHPVSVPPTGSEPRDGFSFGVVLGLRFTLPEALGVVSDALSRQPSSSSTSLRRLRLGVAAQASGTSLPRCFRYSRR